MRSRQGFDTMMQAYSGHLSITGEPNRPAVRIGPSAIDVLTGSNAAFGIMVALHHRNQTGEGQYLETSLYDNALHLISHVIGDYTGTGEMPGRWGPYYPYTAPYGIFKASDRELFIGVSGQFWRPQAGPSAFFWTSAGLSFRLLKNSCHSGSTEAGSFS